MDIDQEIEKLEKRLAELKAIKNNDTDILSEKGNFSIQIYANDTNDVIKEVSTFKELFDFWKSKMNKSDRIFLSYYKKYENQNGGIYIERFATTIEEYLTIVKEITSLNAIRLTSMDFAICTKTDKLKHMAYIKNDYLNWFYDLINLVMPDFLVKYNITEDEYWNRIEVGKKYKLQFKNV